MKGNMGAHLQADNMKFVARSKRYTKGTENSSPANLDSPFVIGLTSRKLRMMQEQRIARVEALKAQVRAGTYKVDSYTLAQRILENNSHFMETLQD